jgi:hypothetical protein
MTEVVVAPQGQGPQGVTGILALYAEGTDEAAAEAAKLTLELIAEMGRVAKDGQKAEEWVKVHRPELLLERPASSRSPAEDAERVHKWWSYHVGKEIGGEDKEEFEARWAEAFRKAKPDFAEGLDAAIAKHEAKPKAEPAAKPKPEEAKPEALSVVTAEPEAGPEAETKLLEGPIGFAHTARPTGLLLNPDTPMDNAATIISARVWDERDQALRLRYWQRVSGTGKRVVGGRLTKRASALGCGMS